MKAEGGNDERRISQLDESHFHPSAFILAFLFGVSAAADGAARLDEPGATIIAG
jgi:hypothetical protein